MTQAVRDPFLVLNQESFEELVTFVDFAAERLTIGFVSVNFDRDRDLIIEALKQEPRAQDVQLVVLPLTDANLRFLADAVKAAVRQIQPEPGKKLVLVLTGLEASIGMVGDYPPLLQDLNYVRDAWMKTVPHPILLFLPDHALTRLAKFAPDFWSWRLGVFEFASLPATVNQAMAETVRSDQLHGSLERQAKQKRIDLLLRLLMQYGDAERLGSPEECKTRAEILLELGLMHQLLGEPSKAEDFLTEALRLTQDTELFVTVKINVLIWLGYLETQRGQLKQAQIYLKKALQIAQTARNLGREASVLDNLARIDYTLGNVDEAIKQQQQALELREQIGNVEGKALSLHELAIIYANQGQVERALALYQQSLEAQESIGNVQGKAATLHQMAGIYKTQGQVERALSLYQQVSEIDESIGNVEGKAATLHQMAGIYKTQGQVERALALYQQSLELKESIGNVQGKAATLSQLGKLIAERGEVSQGIAYVQESVEIYERLKSPYASQVREVLEKMKQQYGSEQA